MSAKIIDGLAVAQEIRAECQCRVMTLPVRTAIVSGLAAITVPLRCDKHVGPRIVREKIRELNASAITPCRAELDR